MSGILSWTFHTSDLTKAEKCLENHSGGDESNAHHPLEVGHPMSLSVFWKRAGRAPLLLFVGHIYLFIFILYSITFHSSYYIVYSI